MNRHGQPWTLVEEEVLRQDLSNKEMAACLGRSEHAVEKRKSLLGIRGGAAQCRTCGKALVWPRGSHGGRPPSFCSRPCRKGAKPEPRSCPVCGKVFTPSHRNGVYCSRTCGKAAWYQRKKKAADGVEWMHARVMRTARWRATHET